MSLDFRLIGDTIRTQRELLNLSQSALADKIYNEFNLNYTRQRISRIENGEGGNILTLDLINALSEIFGCDSGYLLGEIKEKTYDISSACKITGLPENAIENILLLNDYDKSSLSYFLTHDKFSEFIHLITQTRYKNELWTNTAIDSAIKNDYDSLKNEENAHTELISHLWFISNEFSAIAKDITNKPIDIKKDAD